ncbi:metallophosphoesterase [Paenibacillus sp. IHBB 3054]|uniref:metallophosphoesterase n=1 Tax=Paenibacillus sp. IHBB 3054 TaxID=3425689 RepID=UPI003F671FE1
MLTMIKGPYLQWPTEESMTFMWETSKPATSRVEVMRAERIHSGYQGNYKQPEQILAGAENSGYSLIHQLTVSGLEPGTIYFYKVYSQNEQEAAEAGPFPFKTAMLPGVPFSFTVTSETGGYSGFDITGGEINNSIFAQMKKYRPDISLFIGDIVNDGTNYADWDQYFFSPGKELLQDTPCFSCLGNHENGGSWYYNFFAFTAPKNYYSFDYGDAHFIALDSTDFINNDTYPDSSGKFQAGYAQYDFLVQDLQNTSAKWKIVYFHYSPYVSGGYQVEALRALCPLLEQHSVDLVLSSHTIVYERSYPLRSGKLDFKDGIVYVVAGGAGAMPEWLLPKREWFTSQSLAVPHFLQVAVTPRQLEIRAIDHQGALFDKFSIFKDTDGAKEFV